MGGSAIIAINNAQHCDNATCAAIYLVTSIFMLVLVVWIVIEIWRGRK